VGQKRAELQSVETDFDLSAAKLGGSPHTPTLPRLPGLPWALSKIEKKFRISLEQLLPTKLMSTSPCLLAFGVHQGNDNNPGFSIV
jgi:hypothetical protein